MLSQKLRYFSALLQITTILQVHSRIINPLSPNRDENEISLYIIVASSNIQVMRIKETIAKDEMCGYLDKFSLPVPSEMY